MPRNAAVEKPQEQPTEAQQRAREAGAERLRKMNAQRKVAPVRSTRNDLDTADRQVGQDQERRVVQNAGVIEIEPPEDIQIERQLADEKAKNLAFMEEIVTIYVYPTDNPILEQEIPVWNGGRQFVFLRGVDMRVPRKFVEVLARMKKTSFSNKKVMQDDGSHQYTYPSHTGLAHQFVIKDDTPNGRAWLDQVLRER